MHGERKEAVNVGESKRGLTLRHAREEPRAHARMQDFHSAQGWQWKACNNN